MKYKKKKAKYALGVQEVHANEATRKSVINSVATTAANAAVPGLGTALGAVDAIGGMTKNEDGLYKSKAGQLANTFLNPLERANSGFKAMGKVFKGDFKGAGKALIGDQSELKDAIEKERVEGNQKDYLQTIDGADSTKGQARQYKKGTKATKVTKLVEVEKDEVIFDKDFNLKADFVGGKPHSKGGEDYVATDGDIIFPGKQREEVLAAHEAGDYKQLEQMRQKLPKDTKAKYQTGTKKVVVGYDDATGKYLYEGGEEPTKTKQKYSTPQTNYTKEQLKQKALAEDPLARGVNNWFSDLGDQFSRTLKNTKSAAPTTKSSSPKYTTAAPKAPEYRRAFGQSMTQPWSTNATPKTESAPVTVPVAKKQYKKAAPKVNPVQSMDSLDHTDSDFGKMIQDPIKSFTDTPKGKPTSPTSVKGVELPTVAAPNEKMSLGQKISGKAYNLLSSKGGESGESGGGLEGAGKYVGVVNNLVQGMKPAEKVKRSYVKSSGVKYTDMSDPARRESRAASKGQITNARNLSGGSAGNLRSNAANALAQNADRIDRINQAEAGRASEIDNMNTQIRNQDKMVNAQKDDMYDDLDARNRAGKQAYLDTAASDISTISQINEQTKNLKERDAKLIQNDKDHLDMLNQTQYKVERDETGRLRLAHDPNTGMPYGMAREAATTRTTTKVGNTTQTTTEKKANGTRAIKVNKRTYKVKK